MGNFGVLTPFQQGFDPPTHSGAEAASVSPAATLQEKEPESGPSGSQKTSDKSRPITPSI